MSKARPSHRRLAPSVLAVGVAALVLGALASSVPMASADDNGGQSDGAPRPVEVGGGNLPGEKPDPIVTHEESTADAAPALDPGFVDDYSRLYRQVQKGQQRVQRLAGTLRSANAILSSSAEDLTFTIRQRGKAEFALADAADQFSLSVRDLYITGSTDVDVVLSVLGSKPEDVLRNIDSIVYLRSATGNETADYEVAQRYATVVDSAQAAVEIRAAGDRKLVTSIAKDLAKAKKNLKIDEKELQRLISLAAPQTVVGKDGCPKSVLDGTVPEGVDVKKLCKFAVKHAVTPQAAVAVKYALLRLGAPYACGGIGRLDAWRYDCSSYVSRAYSEGAGLKTAGDGWAPSTRNMVPWDGAALDPHYAPIDASKLKPGDLVLYDTCPTGEVCPYRHVVMYLGPMTDGGVPMMAHTNSCGSVAHVEPFWGTDAANYLGSRRVMALPGEKLTIKLPVPDKLHR